MTRKAFILIALLGTIIFCSSCAGVKIKKDCGCGSFNEKAPVEHTIE